MTIKDADYKWDIGKFSENEKTTNVILVVEGEGAKDYVLPFNEIQGLRNINRAYLKDGKSCVLEFSFTESEYQQQFLIDLKTSLKVPDGSPLKIRYYDSVAHRELLESQYLEDDDYVLLETLKTDLGEVLLNRNPLEYVRILSKVTLEEEVLLLESEAAYSACRRAIQSKNLNCRERDILARSIDQSNLLGAFREIRRLRFGLVSCYVVKLQPFEGTTVDPTSLYLQTKIIATKECVSVQGDVFHCTGNFRFCLRDETE